MRRIFLLFLVLFACGTAPLANAQDSGDPAELFLNAYMAVQQGEKLEQDGKFSNALSKYRYAASLLEQVRSRHSTWQPMILDYRIKRTSESIRRLEQRVGGQTGRTPPAPDIDTSIFPGVDAPLPQLDDSPLPTAPAAPPRTTGMPDDRNTRGSLTQLQDQLKRSQEQLRTVEKDKETLANRLDDALKRLDRSKSTEAELRTNLQQLQESLRGGGAANAVQDEIARLRRQIDELQADRDAADEENSTLARRATRQRKEVLSVVKQREAADARTKELEVKFADAAKLTKQLEEAQKQIATLSQAGDDQKQSQTELGNRLAAARREVEGLEKERDAARQVSADLRRQVETAEKQIATVSQERDTVTKQRDDALGQLAKAREAQKQVEKLLADNSSLMQKLSAAEQTIQKFNADLPKKDEEIANLKKEVGSVREQLASTQKQNQQFQTSITELQAQLDASKTQLAQTKADGFTPEERKKMTEENDLLRGIVLRQFKEQARRDQTKKLVLGELEKMDMRSTSLLEQINLLGSPVVKLTEQERGLFKQPQIEILDTEDASTAITIAAPKPEAGGRTPAPPANPPAPGAEASPSPSPTPMDMAKLTQPDDEIPPKDESGNTTAGKPEPAKPTPGASPGPTSAPQVETTTAPNLPEELMPQAREARELFERNQYREAEKIYERMLQKAPNNVYVLSNLGVTRYRAGKMKLAEEAFKKAIAIAPSDAFSHCTLGIVYYQQNKFDEAINVLTKAITINPKYAVAHNYLGITASQKGWQEAALKELETAIALDANYADAHFNLSVIFATQQPADKEKARKHYKRAVELGAEPDNALEALIK